MKTIKNQYHADFIYQAYLMGKSNIDPVGNKGVGAIIVKDGEIIGTGCRWTFLNFLEKEHKTVHAEHMAIMEAGPRASEASIYVTMEPCSTRWHNSINFHLEPCCKMIVEAGIKKVYMGSFDESFGAGGVEYLENHGIEVCLVKTDFEDDIKGLLSGARVEPQVQEEFEDFIKQNKVLEFDEDAESGQFKKRLLSLMKTIGVKHA